ncbi:hypothetical protein B0H11DRAFT_2105856 [Mycena galericulata]|nr:hypothetical protein B0H11DRAFT_2105856 [Mycena galericulata]
MFPLRSPLPDPSAQYLMAATFDLYYHNPPTRPAGSRWRLDERDLKLEKEPNGRLINCGLHTLQGPLPKRPAFKVNLQESLATGLRDLRYAQVWKVECDGKFLVARFYDPLYVLDVAQKFDVFKHIDNAVALETHGYGALADMQGTLLPRCVGCFFTMVPAPAGVEHKFDKRSVQVVLLEFIPGCTLLSVSPGPERPVCDMHRTAIMDAVLLIWHLLILRGLKHLDLVERNLILKQRPESERPFCESACCEMRFKFPTQSLVQKLDGPDQPALDYSTLTPQQIDSLPIAVIDFEDICLVDDMIADMQREIARSGIDFPYSKQHFEEKSRPARRRELFFSEWWALGTTWLPSTYKPNL